MKIPSLAPLLALTAAPAAGQVTLEILTPPPGFDRVTPVGVDFDGDRILAIAGSDQPFETRSVILSDHGPVTILPNIGDGAFPDSEDLSASGYVVAGNFFESGSFRAFRWSPTAGIQSLGTLPSSIPAARAFAISADGRVIVGGVTRLFQSSVPFAPYRWTQGGGFEVLDVPGLDTFSISAHAVDAGGQRVGGDINQIPLGVDGFVYQDGQPTELLSTTSGSPFHEVSDFSADGSTLVGNATITSSLSRPILWTAAGAVEDIPLPTPTSSYARFLKISADGQVVVGRYADTATNYGGLFLWRRGDPTSVDLRDFLVAQGVSAAQNYLFSSVPYLSLDGRVIVGGAEDLQAQEYVGYRVTLAPAPTGSLASTFCATQPANSVGQVGSLSAVGTLDVSLNALELVAGDLPPNVFGYFLASTQPSPGTTPAGSQGLLCLRGTLRSLVTTVMTTGSSGSVRAFIDQDTLPSTQPLMVGSTLHFQGWYRDAGSTSRFTEAASVTFE